MNKFHLSKLCELEPNIQNYIDLNTLGAGKPNVAFHRSNIHRGDMDWASLLERVSPTTAILEGSPLAPSACISTEECVNSKNKANIRCGMTGQNHF